MPLPLDCKLGPYEILSPLGAGGMGEVYRARDTRLDREVAIKVLPEALARDQERILRFEREAKALASLNHPYIAAIYGFEEHQGKRLLIMELAEGETLAQRLARGPLSVDEAIEIGRKIAEGLEAAHDKGIVHRDLKPANIKVTPDAGVKVLDFGLAKALLGEGNSVASLSPTQDAHSPTITAEYTRPGIILGTAGYMSPEQARGRSVDKRTDIWAFGCVLFECLAGGRLFSGETATDSIGAILHKEPEWSLLPLNTPPTIQLLLRRCLAKDRNKRLRDIGDARIELEHTHTDPSASMFRLGGEALAVDASHRRRGKWRRIVPWLISAILASALAVMWWNTRPVRRPVMRLTFSIPENQGLTTFAGSKLDISPDGTRVVFVGRSESGRQLYLRNLSQLDAVPLANTDDALCPFFSPDGEWIAFGQKGKLRKISVLGGPATTICDAVDIRGGSWGPDGSILFAPNPRSGIWRVPAAGGEPVKLTDAGTATTSPSHRWPQWLPDGKTALFTATDKNSDFSDARIMTLSVDTGAQKVVHSGGTYARYVSTGHLVFGRTGTLMAVPFDLKKLEAAGAPIPVLEGVLTLPTFGGIDYAFSQNGALLYVSGTAGGEEELPIWIDRAGKESPISQHKRDFADIRLSPDGRRIAASIMEAGNLDIWILEIDRDVYTRLTTDESVDQYPRWSPDGNAIIYTSNPENDGLNLFRRRADGTGEAERITTGENPKIATSFTPDGSTLVFSENRPGSESDILYLPLDRKDAAPEVLLATTFFERNGTLSPDGKWIAYVSNEEGDPEVYVRPFLRPGARVKISTARGWGPKWSADGKEIFYRIDRKLMAVTVTLKDETAGATLARQLFELPSSDYFGPVDVAADGRFLFWRPAGEIVEQSPQPVVVINWLEELEAKLALPK